YSAAQAAANATATAAGCPASPTTRVNTLTWSSFPPMTVDASKTYKATVKTTAGTFTITLDAKQAPKTVNNFVFLAGKNYFHCVIFHRVITNFMDQTGDPTGTQKGGPGYQFANENVPTSYATGDVAMANSGGTDSNGSQFFLVVPGGATTLNQDLTSGDKYSVFGTVSSGMTVVEKINADGSSSGTPNVTQRILSVTVHQS
ncbi:MAG TPA: peptidylprolyl isomerase, partial [Acidimicrobiales bacterium]